MSKTKTARTQKEQVQNKYNDLFLGTISAISLYIIGSWAIDSGSLWVYALTGVALYCTVRFYGAFIRSRFLNSDKPNKAKVAKK